ncbi:hypothetical protein OK351_04815 [Glutamicibacter sp. MNS18]|nr:hypothetical protein [Glutamicibacter sp. MNS18]MCW4464827.1 hypothetical protein [Glutamicibacter sp. MNS18]
MEPPHFSPRTDQVEAIDANVSMLQRDERTQTDIVCCTGKAFVS